MQREDLMTPTPGVCSFVISKLKNYIISLYYMTFISYNS